MIPIYRSDSYLDSLETRVDALSIEEGYQLITCHEALFAEGGGQPADKGSVCWKGESREVLSLEKHKGDIRLKVEAFSGLQKGELIICRLDFERRYRIMRLHTAQHALAACLRNLCTGYETGGMQISEAADSCEMCFRSDSVLTEETIKQAFSELSSFIEEGRVVTAKQFENIELAAKEHGAIFRPSDPRVQIKGRVRMIVIEGLDANACGGTHLRNTKEIVNVSLLKWGKQSEALDEKFFFLQFALA